MENKSRLIFRDEILSSLELDYIRYPSEREKYSSEFISGEEEVGFDNIMNKMKNSQKKIELYSQIPNQCFNYNCNKAFSNAKSICSTCQKNFCESCIACCDFCFNLICVICSRIIYSDRDKISCCYCN